MAMPKVRNLSDEAESRVLLGDALAALGRTIGLTNEDFEIIDRLRDKAPAKAAGVSIIDPWKA